MKKTNLKKNERKELELFRKLSLNILANKIFLEYKATTAVINVEPEGFVEECLNTNFSRITNKAKNIVWRHFLANLVLNKRKVKNEHEN
jgi:hypothetical protein